MTINIQNEIIELIKISSNKKIKKINNKQLIIGDLLDSFDMIKFISNLEKRYKIKLNSKDLSIHNFEKLSEIVNLIKNKIK